MHSVDSSIQVFKIIDLRKYSLSNRIEPSNSGTLHFRCLIYIYSNYKVALDRYELLCH